MGEAIYNANVAKIQEHNTQGLSWTLDVNEFADISEDEFVAKYTGLQGTPPTSDEPVFEQEVDEPVADAVDWQKAGKVNSIKNQGSCGSCWAFSTVGTLESGYAIATGKLLDLAEQQLVDCDKSDSGCSGGWPHTAYDSYIARAGYCTTASYRYTAQGGSCKASSCDVALPKGTVTGHVNVGKSSSGLLSALSKQPVSVTVNAGQLQFYGNGIINKPCSGSINHAIIAVGYGKDGQDYFRVRNSWGTGWGESGYARLAQNAGSSGCSCLFQYAPVTPSLSVTPVPTPTPSPTPTPTPTPSGAEFSFFYGMNDTASNKFIQKDLWEVYQNFGKEVKLNMHPFVKGSITNYTCANEASPCVLEQASMCTIAVAQTHDQASKYPGQDASAQWHLCTSIHGGDVKADTCYTAAKINKTEVDSCVTNPQHVQVLMLENLLASKDVGAPPFVKVDDAPGVPQYDAIKKQLCDKHPSLSACPSPPPPPPTPPPTPTPTPTPRQHRDTAMPLTQGPPMSGAIIIAPWDSALQTCANVILLSRCCFEGNLLRF